MPLNRGAVLALAEYATKQRKRREDRADKDAEFQRRLTVAGLKWEQQQALAGLRGAEQRGTQASSPAALMQAQQLGLAEALAPLPEGGFVPSELGHPQTNLLLRNRLTAMEQTGLVPHPPRNRLSPSKPSNPIKDLATEVSLMKNLQDVEAFNEAQRSKAHPASRGMFGFGATPAVAAGPTVDTSSIRRRLSALQGSHHDPISDRIQQLRAQGVPDQTIAQHLREKGMDPSQYGL